MKVVGSFIFGDPPEVGHGTTTSPQVRGMTVRGGRRCVHDRLEVPIGSVYGNLPTFTIFHHKKQPHVAKYTIHGSYGVNKSEKESDLNLKAGYG